MQNSEGPSPQSYGAGLYVGALGLVLAVTIGCAWIAAAHANHELRARVDYLQGLNLISAGSKPEGLKFLAESLRLQPDGNPASGLAFQILAELRVNTDLELRGHTDSICHVAFNATGTRIVTASKDHTARIWDAGTGEQVVPPLQQSGAVVVAEFSPDATRVATGTDDGVVQVWDAQTGQPVGDPMKETDTIRSVEFSPDGRLLATASDDNVGRVWDVRSGEPMPPPFKYHDSVFSVRFSPDGLRVVTAAGDGKSDIWDVQTGQRAVGSMRQINSIYTAVFSGDGKRVLTASADHTAKIWDAKTGKALPFVFSHGSEIQAAAFNPPATLVATASWDRTARVWDAWTGAPITPPLQHGDTVMDVIFDSTGNRIATTSLDHTVRIWNARTGDQVILAIPSGGVPGTATFSPDGASLLVASADPVVHLVALPPQDTPPVWLADLADFAATQVPYDASRHADLDKMARLREKLLATSSPTPWEKFGRWYFLESDVRPVSPWGTLSLRDYVHELMARGDRDSLTYALALSHDHPEWAVPLVSMLANPPAPAGKKP